MSKSAINERRETFAAVLAEGLHIQLEPIPETLLDREKVADGLREIDREDYRQKLIVAGFADHPIGENSCAQCMYYVVSGRWCALPEIALPVEPHWWCRLWRI
ncbi:MAG: hypothetical protein IT342_12420 [Candidatus Melainabacteria bacterium]|nr:hypothetical protein [Candidatus Melainabacteria bacterium]